MNTHSLTSPATTVLGLDRRAPARLYRFVVDRFLLLPLGAAIAMVWANTDGESYFRMAHAWAWPVNEIGMAFFLALIAQEVFEAVMPGGALHVWRHRVLPLAGAAGGFAGAALTYGAYVSLAHEMPLAQAWPVACAVDLAAAYYVLRLVYPRRSTPVAFLLVLAVVTDAVAMAVVTLTSPHFTFQPYGSLLLLAALALAAGLRRMNVRSFWPYWLGCGPLSWLAMYWMGIHPALSLVPIVPLLPHAPRSLDLFADRPDADPVHHAEHEWNGIVQIALFLFGLVNAGVVLRHYDTGTWAVMTAALVGRPLGVLGGVWLAVIAGLHLPRHLSWPDLLVTALATSSGFTFALFVTTAVVPMGAVASQVTLGALATAVGAVVALGLAWLTGVGRFAAQRSRA